MCHKDAFSTSMVHEITVVKFYIQKYISCCYVWQRYRREKLLRIFRVEREIPCIQHGMNRLKRIRTMESIRKSILDTFERDTGSPTNVLKSYTIRYTIKLPMPRC
jgi:N-glycosylase/DNA lyase